MSGSSGSSSFTYCSGPRYLCKYRLERHHLAAVISALNQLFGTQYRFSLAKITGGGIEVLEWPGREVGMIKLFCFKNVTKWPWIYPDSDDEWHDSSEVVLDDFVFETELMALYGAPCWTVKELEKWNRAWAQVGVTVEKHTMYPASKYISCGEEGRGKKKCDTTPVKKRFRSVVDNIPRRIKLRIT